MTHLQDEATRLIAECRLLLRHVQADIDHLREELDDCATMVEVDDALLQLAGDNDPGPVIEQLRSEQWERRCVARREGNVVWGRFGRAG